MCDPSAASLVLSDHFGFILVLQVVEKHVCRTLPPPAGRAWSSEDNNDVAQPRESVHRTRGALQHTRLLLLKQPKFILRLTLMRLSAVCQSAVNIMRSPERSTFCLPHMPKVK